MKVLNENIYFGSTCCIYNRLNYQKDLHVPGTLWKSLLSFLTLWLVFKSQKLILKTFNMFYRYVESLKLIPSPLIHVCTTGEGEVCSVFEKQRNGRLLLKLLFSCGSTCYILRKKQSVSGALKTFQDFVISCKKVIGL